MMVGNKSVAVAHIDIVTDLINRFVHIHDQIVCLILVFSPSNTEKATWQKEQEKSSSISGSFKKKWTEQTQNPYQ